MKLFLTSLSTIALAFSFSVNAQTANKSGQPAQKAEIETDNLKSRYIKNQGYLSNISPRDYQSYYGDSLNGFDEAAVAADLRSRFFYGAEFDHGMNYNKRDFINRKYKIGDYAPRVLSVTSRPTPGQGKPLGGINMVNVLPCVNEDFEATTPGQYSTSNAVNGWTIESGTNSGQNGSCMTNTNYVWNTPISEFWIRQTPIFGNTVIGTIPNSPLGGTRVVQMGNTTPGFLMTKIKTLIPVTVANTLFQFAYAGSWNGTGHACCDQPYFRINMYEVPCLGVGTSTPLGCSSLSLTPPGPNCPSGATGYSTSSQGYAYTNWQTKYIDLTPFIGKCVILEVQNGDCSGGAHHGELYFDARCGGSLVCPVCTIPGTTTNNIAGPVSFCAGSNTAIISAPLGYATYSWAAPSGAPPISSANATLQTIQISPPIPGMAYTVYLTSPSGCNYSSIQTLTFTSVNIAGISSMSTCAGGASGSGTVVGNGSGTGYTYNWLNSNSVTVGTQSVVTGLAPGVYSIVLQGLGSVGCGSAVATITIDAGPPGVIPVLKPFCPGNQAFLTTSGGTNFQWYNGNTPIAANAGGTAPNYTVNSPVNQATYVLTYMSQFGCRDSVEYTLAQMTPGNIGVSGVPLVCPGGTNGQALINMVPAQGALGNTTNFFYVSNLNTSTPPFSASLNPTSLITYTVGGLAAGSYTVSAFDGSCKYGTTFNVTAHTYVWSISPTTTTLCPGNNVYSNVSFANGPPSASQYSYSWTPNLYLSGNANTYSSTIISPTIPVGTQTIVNYTIVVTPSLVNCPTMKTIAIKVVNPAAITFTPIPNLCNISSPYLINVSPAAGSQGPSVFSGASSVNGSTGLISPTLAPLGVSSFVYSYTVAGSPCWTSKSATFEVSQFRTAALTNVVPPLCVTNGPFNLMNIVQSAAGGSWKANWTSTPTTPTNAVSGNQFIPSVLNVQVPQTSNYLISYNTTSSPNPTVCPDVSTLLVAVTKTITPYIQPVPAFCTNAAPITMTVTPSGGSWYANSAVSAPGIISPSNAPVPSSLANYSIAVGPCINYAVTTLNTSTFYPATITSTVYPLCYSSNPVNLMSIVQNTTNASWSASAGIVPNSNVFNPAGLLTGVYIATLNTQSSPNAALCPDWSTIPISVLNPLQPNISNVAPLCSNEPALQLTVTPATGWWTSSAYVSSGGIFTPSLASVGNNAVQYRIGTSTCNREQTKFITVEAFVPAKITSALPDQCSTGSPVSLVPITLTSFGTWSGPGISGNTFNPALTGSGTFTITHNTASSPSGLCPDMDAIAVNVYSLATPEITPAGPFCNSSHPVQLKVSPVGGLFGGSSMGVVSLAGKFDPGSASIGDNFVTYSITSGPCLAYAQVTISVEKFVSADFQKSVAAICLIPGKTNPINMNSYVQYPGGFWSGPGIAGNMFDPFQANKGKNNVVVYRTHSMPTATLCPDTSAVRIEVRDVPKVTALSNLDKACSPAEIYFNTPNVMDGVGVGTWNFDDGTEPEAGLNITHIYTRPGTYNVTFTYKDDIGCEALPAKVNPVYIHEIPKADFSIPDEVFISNPDVQLTNLTTVLGDNTYQWKISNLYTLNQVNPVVSLPKIGRYQITLIATTPIGCTDQITKTVEVKNDFNIYIPSSFSPNFDGLNDIFIPVFSEYGLDHKSFEMEIFDRWGHSLFRTKEITKGWDGSVQNKGEPLKEEVYIYKIKYKDLDGNAYSKMGHLTLIK